MERPETDVGDPGPLSDEDPLPEEKARMDSAGADAPGDVAGHDDDEDQGIPTPGA